MPNASPTTPAAAADDPEASDPLAWGSWTRAFQILIVGALVAGVVLRFITKSPLWLDEALSVDIARLPFSDMIEALRHDGHPPLYYLLLHSWMEAFGEGDVAVRSLSGVFTVAALPLFWIAGRRFGGSRGAWLTMAVVALSPYAMRYGTETRMYALVMLLALAGWLLLDDVLRRPNLLRLGGLAVVVGLLLWTHYWAMWLLGVVGLALIVRLVRARRAGRDHDARTARNAIFALVVGGLLFAPWLPNLLYQSAHTGTPWARPVRPTEMLTYTLADLGGSGQAEALVLGWFLALLMATGLTGRGLGGSRIDIDLATRPKGRPFAIAIAGTLAVGTVVGYATGATYASRYAAVFIPFAFLLAALGLAQLSRLPLMIAIVMLLGLGAFGGYRNITVDRSDARRSAEAIEGRADEDALVVYCPDQLGPSTSRLLGDRFDQVTYPRFEGPELVDWSDYTERLGEVRVEDFAQDLLDRAGDRQIFLVYSTEYITHEDTCPALFNAIGAVRPPEVLTTTTEAWEPSAVTLFEAPKP
ncbi:glycosyltransferase family 39 protein [Aquihabitans daechungensis]|uniref:glycosyltransferase family 39 protein n=1 Tax=Aquihabitans daechungensis TaxID=1052257 RepID=UPI003B9FF3BE